MSGISSEENFILSGSGTCTQPTSGSISIDIGHFQLKYDHQIVDVTSILSANISMNLSTSVVSSTVPASVGVGSSVNIACYRNGQGDITRNAYIYVRMDNTKLVTLGMTFSANRYWNWSNTASVELKCVALI